MKFDLHCHTSYSTDGEQTMEALCKRASALGLDGVAITDHLETGHDDPIWSTPPRFDKRQAELERERLKYPQMKIWSGVEIGDDLGTRDEIGEILKKGRFDFHLLSLHLVNGVDPYEGAYFEGRSQQEAYREYAEAVGKSILTFPDFDAVAHLGYVAKFAPYPKEVRSFNMAHGGEILEEVLRFLVKNEKALEVNCSTYAMYGEPNPGADVIKRYVALGGELFTFGSDAHTSEKMYRDVEKGKKLTRELGGKWECWFENRERKAIRL
ncbi:MAG: histidinol-phosphatase HisJ family protein [Oscillospiraceae bacterium]|nr:histidinol-phosphatase HisJ family protein [Oscillospiraceae bacterium]